MSELGPRAHPVLSVDARQVDLDGLHADEELGGYLPVRAPGGDELGHLTLARGEAPGDRVDFFETSYRENGEIVLAREYLLAVGARR